MEEQKKKNSLLQTAIIKLLAFSACALIFIVIAEDIGGERLLAFDTACHKVVWMGRSIILTGFFKMMTNLMHPISLALMSVALIWIFKQGKYGIALFGNLLLTVLLNLTIKDCFMRERPPEATRLVAETGYSFPSGHSMVAASFFGLIIFLFWQTKYKKWIKRIVTIILGFLIFLVGYSRIYLGVHYATDVVAGLVVSCMYLICYTTIIKYYFREDDMDVVPIDKDDEKSKLKTLGMSFIHAFQGIRVGFLNERNMLIHFLAVITVTVFGITLRISMTEWCIVVLTCGLVISFELVNTAMESVVDLVTKEKKPLAKHAKDMAAGAVLVAAICAVLVGAIIFFPKLLNVII